ncbi:unnamed protein product, partial [Nesidiocoris tenuis]
PLHRRKLHDGSFQIRSKSQQCRKTRSHSSSVRSAFNTRPLSSSGARYDSRSDQRLPNQPSNHANWPLPAAWQSPMVC